MKKQITLFFSTILFLTLLSNFTFANDHFWIGGTGNWKTVTNWSATSGGAPGTTYPGLNDNAIFDSNSGLSIATTVTIDTTFIIDTLDFSGVATDFTFSSSETFVEIRGSIIGNSSGATINWLNGKIIMNGSVGQTILSGATIWNTDFVFNGFGIQLIDNFNTGSGNITINDGAFNSNGKTVSCWNFVSSTTNARNINISNSIVNFSGTNWSIDSTLLTWNATSSTINASYSLASPTLFNGGNLVYDTLRSTTSDFQFFDNNSFGLIESLQNFRINNGSIQKFDSLSVTGNCTTPFQISSITPGGTSPQLEKTGYSIFYASNLILDNVDANSPTSQVYNLYLSDTINGSNGWNYAASKFYWVGNSGDWTDANHWSFSSGGPTAICTPTLVDSVIFDANSFSSINQVVTVNADSEFGYMDWTNVLNSPTLNLGGKNLISYGDVNLNNNIIVTRDSLSSQFKFVDQANFNPVGALFDCNISIYMNNTNDSLLLQSNLNMTDSTAIYLVSGKAFTQGNDVTTGSILVLTLIGTPTLDSLKHLDLGSSNIQISQTFNSRNSTSNFTFNGGTSNIYIGDTDKVNSLLTEGLLFNNVTLDFNRSSSSQRLGGNNTFKKLEIIKGSKLIIYANSTQTILDSLVMIGDCKDSIYLASSSSTPANFFKTTSTNVFVEVVDLTNISCSSASLTALFSTGNGTTSGWNLSTTPVATSLFTIPGTICFGDTTAITNSSTAYSGNVNDLTTYWFFNDGSTGYYANPPTDSTWITYVGDTNQHVFTQAGDITVQLVSEYTNFCTDTASLLIHINQPDIFLASSSIDTILCAGEQVTFDASSTTPSTTFEFFINGVSQNTPTVNDTLFTTTLNNGDTVSVASYENGCITDSIPEIYYHVNANPVVNWTSTDLDTSICDMDSVYFNATGADKYQFFINSNSVTPILDTGLYATNSFVNNDTIFLIGTDTLTTCVDTVSSMIFTVNPLPTTTFTESSGGNVICAGDNVTFTASGANTYEFFIDGVSQGVPGGNTFSTASLVTGDTVTVLGYSTQGCSKFAPGFFTYTVNSLPNVNITSSDLDTSICSNESVIFTSSGASLYQFFINGTSQGAASATNSLTSSSLNNNDSITVIGTFSGCQQSSDTLIFEVLTAPSTTLVSDDADSIICDKTTVVFTANGATNYEFFINGISQGPASATNTFTSSTLNNNDLISVNGTSNTCVISQSIPFTVLPLPPVNLFSNDPNDSICLGDAITFTGANAAQYELFVNNTSQGLPQSSPTFNPSLPGGLNSIFLIGTGGNGCADTSSTQLSILVTPLPSMVLSSSDLDATICNGESVTFTGNGSDLYQFFIDGTPQGSLSTTNTLTTTNLIDGQTITVNGTTLGCLGSSNSITFNVNPIPTVSVVSSDIDNVFCLGDIVNYTASGATNYEFFVDGVSQGSSSAVNTLTSAGFSTGTYDLFITGESNSCSNSTSLTLTVNGLPNALISSSDSDNQICSGDEVTYSATGGNFYEFIVNGISQGAQSPISTLTTSSLNNNDIVGVTVTGPTGCVSSNAMTPITVNSSPTIVLNSSDIDFQICSGDEVVFTGTGGTEYEFFVNGNSQGPSSMVDTIALTTILDNDVISAIGSTLGCPSPSNSLNFTVNNAPVVLFTNNGDTAICTGESTNLSALGATNYQFFVNGISTGPYSPIATFTSPVNNNDVISVNGESNGCISTSNANYTFLVNTYPTLTSSSSDADNIICLDDQVDFTTSGATEYSFNLNGANLQSGTSTNFGLNYLSDGDVITITGYNGDCASSVDTYTFTVNSMNLDLSITPSTMICDGELVTVTATGADEYEFFVNGASIGAMSTTNTYSSSTLNDLDEITYSGLSNTTSCLQVYDDYIIMNVLPTPSYTALSSTTFCQGDSVQLLSNSNSGNQWLLNGSPIANETDSILTVSTAGDYSLEVSSGGNGDLWSFGMNATGTFGNGNNLNNAEPTPSNSPILLDEISSGADFVVGVTNSGDVYAWGENSSGQLGNGTYTSENTPIQVPTLSGVKTIATSESSAMAITNSGDVYVWGNNTQGQLGTGNTSVVNFPMINSSLSNTDSIAGGLNHFVILKTDGSVWTVGNNDYGQLGTGDLTTSYTPVQVSSLSGIIAVGAGEYHSFAIDNTGDLYVWGNNGSGQLGMDDINNRLIPVISPLKNIINAQGGATHSVFLSSQKKVFTSGGNAFGQLGTGDFNDTLSPIEVNVQGATMISAGQYTTLVKRTDNSVFGFGNNTEDQLSSTNGTMINTPEHISDLNGVGFIEAGKSSSHVLYSTQQQCSSSATTVTVNPVPVVTINNTSNTLTTVAGISYQWYFNGQPITAGTTAEWTANETGNYSVEVTFANGCSGLSSEVFISFVGLEDLVFGEVKLFPNPTSDQLTISLENTLDERTSVQIIDQFGRLISEESIEGISNHSISVYNLENGVYHIVLTNTKQTIRLRFVKTTK